MTYIYIKIFLFIILPLEMKEYFTNYQLLLLVIKKFKKLIGRQQKDYYMDSLF